MQSNGSFIVLEGTDSVIKREQFARLTQHLRDLGYSVETFDFPRYDQESSHFVHEYLKGNYGSPDEVGPYTGSLFYALDRFEASIKIREALSAGKIVLANRFTGSNMAHMGTKFNHAEERRGFFIWLDNLEFQMLNIPRPDRSIVLRVPAQFIQQTIEQSANYSNNKPGTGVASSEHIKKFVEVYDDLCQLFPKDFIRIDCVRSKELMDSETISKLVWETVSPIMPAVPIKRPQTVPANVEAAQSVLETPAEPNSSADYVIKTKTGYEITDLGREFLTATVTNLDGNVYAFNELLSSTTVAAAMARLSRRGDDLRITLLDEFAKAAGKDQVLLHKVITAYGDDSVQQLTGQHLVVEGASNLLTKKLEWGRLAAYLEQSTRYIFYDQKDKQGHYKYYLPPQLDKKTKTEYRRHMDRIFELYSEMVHKLTDYVQLHSATPQTERDVAWKGATRAQACDAIRPVLPVATKSTVGIFASGQALESLIMHLQSDALPEARKTGDDILMECRKVIPAFLERADKPERGGAMIAYRAETYNKVKSLAQQHLQQQHAPESPPVVLTGVWPRNELDLIPDMLYEHSNLPLKQIEQQVATWPYEKKQAVFTAYMGERLNRRHRPGRAIEKAHYSWDLVCDYGIFRDLQRHRMVDDLQWQTLTPRYGYEVPQLVDDAGLTDLFEECFALSLALHSTLMSAGYEVEAQYATLLGHRMRWKVTYNAREAFHLHELRTSPQGHPGYRKLVMQMHEKLAEVHPMLADAMNFVNKDEDAELTRLAAERYTQFKQQQLH